MTRLLLHIAAYCCGRHLAAAARYLLCKVVHLLGGAQAALQTPRGKSWDILLLKNIKAYTPLPPPHIGAEVLGTGSCWIQQSSAYSCVCSCVGSEHLQVPTLQNITSYVY